MDIADLLTLIQQVFNYLIDTLMRVFTAFQEVDGKLPLYELVAEPCAGRTDGVLLERRDKPLIEVQGT